MPAYRLTLYKKAEGIWHYCQITAGAESGLLSTALGICGATPEQRLNTALPTEADPFSAVKEAGATWRTRGYDYPTRKDMTVMSLHFKTGNYSGWPAGAPWFEDWKTYYQEPIDQQLSDTANGIATGSHRARGHYLLYYYVLNAEAARQTVERITAAAPVHISVDIHLSDREIRPNIQLADGVPPPLADLYKGFEEMAHTLAEASQNVVFQTVTLTPQPIHESSRKRIRGAEALTLRQALKDRWGFNCTYFPPLGGDAREEVVYLTDLAPDVEQALFQLLSERLQEPVYVLDCEEGLFRIGPNHIFRGAYEGVVFDDSLDWIIYFSHHNTITFGGKWLIEAVEHLHRHQPGMVQHWTSNSILPM
jgi:hypothetical protein